ncbi:RNA polymerase II holoenzyme cyclin-like subunit [Intoshia linei]|uniref:RNA polymerase II holoenzyme cyclin-like subunit n=1 Tax=Intoshia linei TaxID=1819745 RepID=A0A177AZR5_9BILA|nr:RNA polymerase II holoenzyme cyclin-like subunit [Intoshia linei]
MKHFGDIICKNWLYDEGDLQIERNQNSTYDTNYDKIIIFYANFIQAIGEYLKIRQQVIATATIYLKRFYIRNSFYTIDPLLLSPTTLFLAVKVEEFGLINYSRMLLACQSVCKTKFPNVLKSFTYRKNDLFSAEFHLLEKMDFSLIVFNPYRNLVLYVGSITTDTSLLQLAWRLINDMLRTDIPLLYPPHLIALSAIHFAAVIQDIKVGDWFAQLNVDITKIVEITRLINKFHEFYQNFNECAEISNLIDKFTDKNPYI